MKEKGISLNNVLFSIFSAMILLFFITFTSCDSDTESLDIDSDGIENSIDNCVNTSNANQIDTDSDGIGDACDDDIDGNGIVNSADSDMDGDGLENNDDNCPYIYNATQADADGDGIGNACEA